MCIRDSQIYSVLSKALQIIVNNRRQYNVSLLFSLMEILQFLIQVNINTFSNFYLAKDENSSNFTNALCNILKHFDQGLQIQVVEILKYIMDPMHDQKHELIDYTYDQLFPELLTHYSNRNSTGASNSGGNEEVFYSFIQQYFELLIFCIKNHGFKIRHYLISHKVLQQIFKGSGIQNKSVTLAMLRILKTALKSHDEFLIKHIHTYNILDKLFPIYFRESHKTNMINSACLEIFSIILKDDIKKLIQQIVEKFGEEIKKKNLQKQFEKLFQKYEQFQTPLKSSSYMQEHGGDSASENMGPPSISASNRNDIMSEDEVKNEQEREKIEEEEYFDSEEPPENFIISTEQHLSLIHI
eukprot:TRINITY_DN5880_c0_g2_i3.p1 TRINITY_DN5880_c0_g2~~TRINITY_DN5880_c0_g2_i3.p1  ORF type:complete len:355 (-),score=37.96 TRINITY_DN5880_c0_g2_i3:2-1066(-)